MSSQGQNKNSLWFKIKPFVIGGTSGICATLCVQPIDITKVRIQALNELKSLGQGSGEAINPVNVFKNIVAENGAKGLYVGLGAAILRQISYTTVRLGIFRSLSDWCKEKNQGAATSLGQKVGCALTAGFIGSIFGNPVDLTLIRFQTDGMLPPEERRNYKNVFDALGSIVRDEGFAGLFKGVVPTVVRAMLLNVGMLASFDEIKERLNSMSAFEPNSIPVRCIASGAAGVIAATMSLPGDNIKTKLQKQKPDANGKLPYAGFVDCVKQSIAREGVKGLWVGLGTFQIRIAPHCIITLLAQEFLNNVAKEKGY